MDITIDPLQLLEHALKQQERNISYAVSHSLKYQKKREKISHAIERLRLDLALLEEIVAGSFTRVWTGSVNGQLQGARTALHTFLSVRSLSSLEHLEPASNTWH